MRPVAKIVASPGRSKALRARVVRARKDERSFRRVLSCDKAERGQVLLQGPPRHIRSVSRPTLATFEKDAETHVDHAVDVVNIAVFPTSVVDGIFLHCDLGAVEDGGLSAEPN